MLKLKELRAQRKLSQLQLAKAMNVSRSTVAMWERGTEPSQIMLKQLADFFEVSVDYLLDRQETKTATALDSEMSDIDFALSGELRALTDDEKQDILDYVRFKQAQKKKN